MRKLAFLIALLLALSMNLTPAGTAPVQARAATVVYNLYATDGYYELPDGNPLYIYGFIGGREGVPLTYQTSCTPGPGSCTGSTNVTIPGGPVAPQGGPWIGQDAQFAGNAQFPAPIVYASTSDIVEIRLKNLGVAAQPTAPNDPHSIHLHGLDVDAANDGVPETSLGAVPANLCADGSTAGPAGCEATGPAPGAGNVIVYMFSPSHAGSYMYHCHQEADIHVQMGMFGALVVYNPGDPAAGPGPGQGQGGTLYDLNYDKDYILLLSEFDIRGHQDEEGTYVANPWDPDPYNWALYKPQYWSINGLSFPQTLHAAFPSGYTFNQWIAAHPGYDPLITGSVSSPNAEWGTPGEKVLIRVINMGFQTHPMHMHGYHGKVIGSDQRAWTWGHDVFNAGLEKNTLKIGSGETYDWLVDFGQQSFQSIYPAGTQSRYDPASNLPEPNTATGMPAIPEAGDPAEALYIGGPTVVGLVGGTEHGIPYQTSQFFPFHNHDDYKATNNGLYPGGMFTMLVPTP